LVKHTTRIVDKHLKIKIEIRLKVQESTGIRYFDISASSKERGSFFDKILFVTRVPPTPYSLERSSQEFPELKPIIDLHLSDTLGQPPFVLERGWDIIQAKTREDSREFFRITKKEYNLLFKCLDQADFLQKLSDLGIRDRWKSQALKALKTIEKMCFPICGMDFTNQNPYIGEQETPYVVVSASTFR
tara:strand:+ start:8598 stop:9161 length:564 start_codon:yes stop_codon:yes gene_type:complete